MTAPHAAHHRWSAHLVVLIEAVIARLTTIAAALHPAVEPPLELSAAPPPRVDRSCLTVCTTVAGCLGAREFCTFPNAPAASEPGVPWGPYDVFPYTDNNAVRS